MLRQLDSLMQKNEGEPLPPTIFKNLSKVDHRPNVKAKIIKHIHLNIIYYKIKMIPYYPQSSKTCLPT